MNEVWFVRYFQFRLSAGRAPVGARKSMESFYVEENVVYC